MGLRDELEQTVSGGLCQVGVLLETLPADVRVELIELMADPSVQSSALARLAKKKDWRAGEQSFARHRRGACKCR